MVLVPVTASVGVLLPDNTTEFTLLGVMAPRVRVMSGVVVGFATLPDTPFAVTTDTLVTVPDPEGAAAHVTPPAPSDCEILPAGWDPDPRVVRSSPGCTAVSASSPCAAVAKVDCGIPGVRVEPVLSAHVGMLPAVLVPGPVTDVGATTEAAGARFGAYGRLM